MPLTNSGKKILAGLKREYGSEKGETIFYKMINSGKLKGAESGKK